MKSTHAAATTILLLSASACASLTVGTDYDQLASFGRLSTYSWIEGSAETSANPAFSSPLLNRRIRHAADSVLGSMGFQRVPTDDADFRVSYDLIAEEKADVSYSGASGYGYGGYGYGGYGYAYGGFYGRPRSYGFGGSYGSTGFRGFGGLYGRRGYYGIGPSYGYGGGYAREYVEGTLVIDVVDAQTDEVIWRGWSNKDLGRNPKPDKIGAYVTEAVVKILADFPPNRRGRPAVVAGSIPRGTAS